MRQRILFVGGDAQFSDGLRRMRRDGREPWEMRFAGEGAEGLALLEEAPVDLVVAAMRLPGMDGPGFLEEVRRRWPGTLRLLLCGAGDLDAAFRARWPVHQVLPRPCAPGELEEAVGRALRLAPVLAGDRLRDVIGRIGDFPALPAVFAGITEELRSPSASARTIGGIVSRDVGLAAGILRRVNSPLFGMRRPVPSTEEAVALLGFETSRGLVLWCALLSWFDGRSHPGFDLEALWRHSLGVARCARAMAGIEGADKADKDACFLAGLLHDVGKPVMAASLGAEQRLVLAEVRARNMPPRDAEMELLGVSHAEIGGYLLGLWGFAEAVAHGVARHHAPVDAGPGASLVVPLVHAANALEHEVVVVNEEYAPHPLDAAFLEGAGLAGRVPVWGETCRSILLAEASRE